MSSSPTTKTKHLIKPAEDIRYLLSQGYPRKSAITFVGNHYRLDELERHILTRVVHCRNHSAKMKETAAGTHIVVDGYNVLITVETALSGGEVYLCDDGLVRDTRGVFSRYQTGEMTLPAIHAIIDALENEKPARVTVIFDAQMKYSDKLKDMLASEFAKRNLKWNVLTSRHADFDIKELAKGVENIIPAGVGDSIVVATGDSAIIDVVPELIDIPAIVCKKKGFFLSSI